MTQRPLGNGSGIMAAKSYLRLEKWLKPVNRNMITRAMRPASLQEESRFTPSAPKPRRTMNEMTKTNREIMSVLSVGGAVLSRFLRKLTLPHHLLPLRPKQKKT